MRYTYRSMFAVAVVLLSPSVSAAQADTARSGGISVPGWTGKTDGTQGTMADARLAKDGDALHVYSGPGVTFWNPANTASGKYTVKATFTEPKYMGYSNHPHPYGVMIGGNDLGTDQMSLMYCGAYGNGTFIVRGFGPAPFRVNGRQPEANPAVHKAAGVGQPVTQDVAIAVKADSVSCIINGTTVGTWAKSALVTAGQLKSTDGVWGLRFSDNTDVLVTGLAMTKN